MPAAAGLAGGMRGLVEAIKVSAASLAGRVGSPAAVTAKAAYAARVAADADPGRAARRAAVLVPFCDMQPGGGGGGGPSLIYTVRTDNVGSHKGQVSFPGGHIEPDESPEHAAVRELQEELGQPDLVVEVLGSLEPLPAITGTMVTPVLGFLPGVTDLVAVASTASTDEVAEVFAVPLAELMDRANQGTDSLTLKNGATIEVPFFNGGGHKIWGLTGTMTHTVLRKVVRNAAKAAKAANTVDANRAGQRGQL